MAYSFTQLDKEIQESVVWLSQEMGNIRTSRATPALLDSVRVLAYGVQMPLNQVATISIEDPRTLRIAPWDQAQLKEIERAIMLADLGVSVALDDTGARVSFPELTAERREALKKIAKERLEEARKRLRQIRDDVWNDIQESEAQGILSEDEKFRCKDEMQKRIDKGNGSLEDLFFRKDKEISQ